MTNIQAGQPDTAYVRSRPDGGDARRPKAVGLVRTGVSGLAAPRHAAEISRHAEQLGYDYLYTVRPPEHPDTDPIGYGLAIATGVQAAALIVYDLASVDNTPARVCETCDLETVCPPVTWARAMHSSITPDHAHPDHPLTVAESHRIMQRHITCRAITCPLKSAALRCLVRAGALVPPAMSPRERAAARGLPFEPIGNELPPKRALGASGTPSPSTLPSVWRGPDLATLLDVLDALTATDSHATRDTRS
ncbi:hypothetical protein [Nocardia pseudovaccinii]|uniref:hypothetical protein n=1 Tax=Nocardia pseudovaccinii TaxID=189540 RepID=UPI0007A4C0DC|nr:hypothetical protein [Nocardia pseudovaccinii]